VKSNIQRICKQLLYQDFAKQYVFHLNRMRGGVHARQQFFLYPIDTLRPLKLLNAKFSQEKEIANSSRLNRKQPRTSSKVNTDTISATRPDTRPC